MSGSSAALEALLANDASGEPTAPGDGGGRPALSYNRHAVAVGSSHWRSAFRVGDWIADPASGRVARGAEERHVPPLTMDLLRLLARHAGQVVTKQQILDEVWQGRFVSESALTRAVAELRALLDDAAKPARYIETIPKRGYRMVARIEPPHAAQPPALAILPFDNLTREPGDEYIADGVTDAIITELGKMATLRVISRQSTLRFKGARDSVREIARQLSVDHIVEGSLLREGNRLRLTTQLIEADPERHLWADSYDCEVTGVLALQRLVAERVAASIHVTLRPAETMPPRRPRQVHPDAHLAYLKGCHFLASWTREGVQKGIGYLWQSVQIDPACAPAYEQLAIAMMVLGYFGYVPREQAFGKGKEAALKALELDDTQSMAHVALGFACWLQDWNLAACEREFARGIELNPNNQFALLTRALYLVTMRNDVDGMSRDVEQALEIDPLGLHTNFATAWLRLFARQFDLAREQAVRTIELHKDDAAHAVFVLALAHAAQGRFTDAAALLEPVAPAGGDLLLAALGNIWGQAGETVRARAVLDGFEKRRGERGIAVMLATVLTGLSDHDAAFAAFEQALAERDGHLFWLPLVPIYGPLRADPRFGLLMARIAPPGAAGGSSLPGPR